MASLEEEIDPRIAVILVWAIFFFVFIILPSVCIRLGCCSNVDIDDIPEYELSRHGVDGVDDDPEFASRLDRYNMFSPAQNRHRIDKLRSEGIKRYVGRFSILLEKGHMMCLNENGEAIEPADTVGSLSYDGTCFERDEECQDPPRCDASNMEKDEEVGSQKEEQEGSSSDFKEIGVIHTIMAPTGQLGIELTMAVTGLTEVSSIREDSPLSGKLEVGDTIIAIEDEDVKQCPPSDIFVLLMLMREASNAQRKITILRGGINNMEDGASNSAGSSNDRYTHVQIPFPGCDIDGLKLKEESIPVGGKSINNWRFPFVQKKIQVNDIQEPQEEEAEIGDTNNDDNVMRTDVQRNVPHFCAVCLGEYAISETISWSSNPHCTHVFHQECIIKWLNTLGRKMTKYHRFGDDPSVLQLLNYKLECPCCRQDFISRSALVDEGCCGDENDV